MSSSMENFIAIIVRRSGVLPTRALSVSRCTRRIWLTRCSERARVLVGGAGVRWRSVSPGRRVDHAQQRSLAHGTTLLAGLYRCAELD
jgi:hypothetical protein